MAAPSTDQYAGDAPVRSTIASLRAEAAVAEEIGFDGVTAPEAGHDPFLPLMLAAEHTSRIALGTNVAIAFPRSPMVTAQAAWDLQALSGGRFRLGLGSQVKGHVERRYAGSWTGPAGPRMREYVQCLRAMFESFQDGSRPSFEGEHYRFTLMSPFFNPGPVEHPHVPIELAAVNTYMAKLAGELGDGLRVHPIATFRYVDEVVRPAVAAGAAAGGRDPSAVAMVGSPFLAVARDADGVEKARQELKQHIAFYASTRTYHAVLRFHGWEDLGTELHQMSRDGRWKEMPALITDPMLDEWAVTSTADDLAAALARRCTGVFDTLLLDLPGSLRRDRDWLAGTVAALHAARPRNGDLHDA